MTPTQLKIRFYIVFGIIALGITTNFLAEHHTHVYLAKYTENQTRILEMIKFEDRLDKLRNDITLVQSRIRGYVITSDPAFVNNIENEIHQIGNDMLQLKLEGGDDVSLKPLLDSLDLLVKSKIQFSYHTLETFKTGGKAQTEELLKKGTGVDLRNRIYAVIDKISQVKTSLDHGSVNSLIIETENNRKNLLWLDGWLPYMILGFFILLGLSILLIFYQNIGLLHALSAAKDSELTASIVKDQFVANVSHEIRTPLNSILGYANLLDNTTLTEVQRKYLHAVRISSEMLKQVVNSILDFSRLESGLVLPEKIKFNPCELVNQLRLSFEEIFANKGLDFSIECATDMPQTLAGDVIKMNQVFTNLLGNALKFTEKGFVKVSARVQSNQDKTCWLEFSVKDSGIGIDENKIPLIFDRYYQTEQGNNRKFEGTGLGLPITKRLVDNMGGRIRVESQKGNGSEFTVLLPFEYTFEDAVENFIMPQNLGRDKKVLVVDDNEFNRDLVQHVLHSWNFTVVLAQSAAEAVVKLTTEKFNVVFLDIQMPEVDGYELARRIRKELHLTTPIVALTAHSGRAENEKCKAAGMDDFVTKPFSQLELYGVISRVTENASSFLKLQYLRELSKGNVEFEHRIMRQVTAILPMQLKDLRHALEQNDKGKVATISHDLLSHLAIFRLENDLAPSFTTLNGFANNQPVEGVLLALDKIESTCNLLLRELKSIT
jgi:signal transduction histidine kinase/CheY-like chemotaxis protein/CHASE3 domain sensor protein